jgi:hypothetical protein
MPPANREECAFGRISVQVGTIVARCVAPMLDSDSEPWNGAGAFLPELEP